MNNSKVSFVVLAAGNGSRFGPRPKVLHDLCGKPILHYVLDLVKNHNPIVVASPALEKILETDFKTIVQPEPCGTGQAFELALEMLSEDSHVFVLLGDMPLLQESTIQTAVNKIDDFELIFGKFSSNSKNQYGRVKENELSYEVLEYDEHPGEAEFYNAGWMCINKNFINTIKQYVSNKKELTKEVYLTKYIQLTKKCLAIEMDESECVGINTMEDYSKAYKVMQSRFINKAFMEGVDFIDPDSVKLRFDTKLSPGCKIHSNVVFGANVSIGEGTEILPFTYIEQSSVGKNCTIGPFCYLRKNTQVMDQVHLGSFCEVKNSFIGNESKSKHQSYIGDAQIGEKVNIGAGVVFLNYDGKNKHKSIVGNNCFLGGNSAYVAPVEIGADSYVGAGTIVRENVAENSIYVTKPKNLKCKRS